MMIVKVKPAFKPGQAWLGQIKFCDNSFDASHFKKKKQGCQLTAAVCGR
jgi:hypothetical protein